MIRLSLKPAMIVAFIFAPACMAPERTGDAAAKQTTETSSPVRIVGSSTVFPFSAKVAEIFSNRTGTPIVVEQTGSGGGHKLFCSGSGSGSPDMTNSSRPQKASEYALCRRNGVSPVIEVQVGYDGIILARSVDAVPIALSLDQLYLATAKEVPLGNSRGNGAAQQPCQFIPNPYQLWSDISPVLPKERIEVYGPPPTSGTRDAFVETALERGARRLPCMAQLEGLDNSAFHRRVQTLREDGRWIDAGENDNAVVQTLINAPRSIGVIGYSFLDQNKDKIAGLKIDGFQPEFDAIREGQYPIVRSLFLYLNGANMVSNVAIADFALEFTSEDAAGAYGYLDEVGLIPINETMRADMRRRIEQRIDYRRPGVSNLPDAQRR